MSSLLFDLRDAVRGLRRDSAYAATVIGTLALTIGAATAVFSIVDGVLLKPLAYRESQRLVALQEIWRQFSDRMPTLPLNERHFDYWREHARSFESMAQYVMLPANLTGAGDAAQITVVRTSGSLFDVLQVQPVAGRTLEQSDERTDRPDAVVLTDRALRQRFNGDLSIVGRAITIDGRARTVVGVLPPDFRLPRGEQLTADIDAFIPVQVNIGWVGDHNDQAIGRLRAGVTPSQARAELDVLQQQVSEIATKEAHETITLAAAVTPLAAAVVGRSGRGLMLLFGAIIAVLLIACSNLANLSLTRTTGRLRDAAIRSALGASRARLIVRALLEQVLLALSGGALGVWVAWAALGVFVRTAPVDLPRVADVKLDARVLAFAAIVSLMTAILVAMLPAWRTAARDVQTALRAGGGATTSDRGGLRTRSALLALQVGLSVALLTVTGLLTASFMRVLNVDRGFSADRVLAVGVALPASRYAEAPARQAAFDRLLDAVHALPGVERVTTTSMLPLGGQGQVNSIGPEGSTRPRSDLPTANFRMVAPEFFQTLGITITRGRAFTIADRDPNRALPALVSEPTAARLWPGLDPLGRRFSRGLPGERGFEVVGVATDARLTVLERQPPLMVYVPYWYQMRLTTSLLVKTAGDPTALLPAVRRAVHDIDPEIAIGDTGTVDELVDKATAARRYQAQLFVAFGVMALLIATIGVYAVTSYNLSRRRREMNIRVAFGAEASQVRAMIVRESVRPLLAGAAGGVAGALSLGGVVASLLFDVRPRDPLVIGGVTVVVATVGLMAALIAVKRGLSIDPAAALREE